MKITYIQSQLSFLLFTLIFQLTKTLASPTNELILAEGETQDTAVEDNIASRYGYERGYECGNTFFYEPEVEEALYEGLHRIQKKNNAQRYLGPLYNDAESSEYLLFPVNKINKYLSPYKYKPCHGLIVYKSDKKKVIDVITRISNNHFTKCIKRDGSQTELSTSVFENTNGYQCGHEFFSDQIIQKSHGLAKSKIGGNTRYPAPYQGNLFLENSEYLIWPILYRRVLHTSGNGDVSLYSIIISKNGDLIDVVVKGLYQNFLRCTRTRKTTAPKSDPLNKLFVPAPTAGFQCGMISFNIDALNKAAETAEMVYSKKKIHRRFPIAYDGDPFNEPCWLWPIFENGKLYRKAKAGPFRVVLTKDFKVMSVISVDKDDKITVCESIMLRGKRNHETSNYYCNGILITNEKLVTAAEMSCERIHGETRKNSRFFPARYEGPRFEKDGPYMTFPVFMNGKTHDGKTKKPGRFRVVMNQSCEVVGALFVIRTDKSEKKLVKCHRVREDHSFEEYPYDLNEPISEHRVRY